MMSNISKMSRQSKSRTTKEDKVQSQVILKMVNNLFPQFSINPMCHSCMRINKILISNCLYKKCISLNFKLKLIS